MSEMILPKGWGYQVLDTFLSFALGGDWGKSADYDNPDYETVYCIRGTEISYWSDTKGSTAVVRKIKSNSLEKRRLKAGDILVEISGGGPDQPVGRTVVIDEKVLRNFDSDNVVCTNFLRLFRPLEEIDSKYLNYYLQMFYNSGYINEYQSGSNNLRNLKFKDFLTISIPYPPLHEQKQIVLQLERYFQTVSQIQARLDAIPKILEKFRQSVLRDAMNGTLTEEWRNLNLHEKMFKHEDELTIFRTEELAPLPESWQWLNFGTVATIASNLQDPNLTPQAIHLAPNHIESFKGKVHTISTIEKDGVKSAKHGFKKGQIIYSKIRPYLCKVVIANFDGLCSADMYPINPIIDTKYLFYWMLSSKFTFWASNAESRVVLPKINQKDLNKIPTPTPPIEEQTEIVKIVNQLFAHADQIEKSVAVAKARVDNLTQSILHQAFTGKLTADWREQNLELISGDNSAEALLAKIQAEKKAAAAAAKASKKGTKKTAKKSLAK